MVAINQLLSLQALMREEQILEQCHNSRRRTAGKMSLFYSNNLSL
jgi:hypothetical protein